MRNQVRGVLMEHGATLINGIDASLANGKFRKLDEIELEEMNELGK